MDKTVLTEIHYFNPSMTLQEWHTLIQSLTIEYGVDQVMSAVPTEGGTRLQTKHYIDVKVQDEKDC